MQLTAQSQHEKKLKVMILVYLNCRDFEEFEAGYKMTLTSDCTTNYKPRELK